MQFVNFNPATPPGNSQFRTIPQRSNIITKIALAIFAASAGLGLLAGAPIEGLVIGAVLAGVILTPIFFSSLPRYSYSFRPSTSTWFNLFGCWRQGIPRRSGYPPGRRSNIWNTTGSPIRAPRPKPVQPRRGRPPGQPSRGRPGSSNRRESPPAFPPGAGRHHSPRGGRPRH